MVFAIAAIVLQQGSLSKALGPPTGKNGYEEFLRAGDMSMTPIGSAVLRWRPNLTDEDLQVDDPSEQPTMSILKDLRNKTPLQVARFAYEKLDAIPVLIHQGVQKPVYDPRPIDLASSFPGLAGLRSISKLDAMFCRAMLADGHSAQAMQLELDSLEMARKIKIGVIISDLVGDACQAIALASFNENLDRFDERDWQTLLVQTKANLGPPTELQNCLHGEATMAIQSLEETLKPTEDKPYTGDDPDVKWLVELNHRSPDAKAQFRERVQAELNAYAGELDALVSRPENEWANPPEVDDKTEAGRFLAMVTPPLTQVFAAELKLRTQMRLLRLHAYIQVYRWNWGKLPDALSDAVPAAELHDPVANADFAYERTPSGYRLYGHGTSSTGEIDLKYVRQASPDGDPDAKPG